MNLMTIHKTLLDHAKKRESQLRNVIERFDGSEPNKLRTAVHNAHNSWLDCIKKIENEDND